MGQAAKPTKIEINNETVAVWEGDQVVWVENTPRMAQALFGQQCTPSGVLPMAVRWIGPAARVWVWERPPIKQAVLYSGIVHAVQMPWTVMVVDTAAGEVRAFARPGPIGSEEDVLHHLPLPGINKEGRLPILRMRTGHPAEQMLAKALELFQNQQWLGEVSMDWQPPELRQGSVPDMLEAWSKAGPLDVVEWGWVPRITLGELTHTNVEFPSTVREVLEQAVRRV